MADSRYAVPGASVGTGRVTGFRNKLDQRLYGRSRQPFHNELVLDPRQPLPMSDIPPGILRIKTDPIPGVRQKAQRKDVSFDRPMSVAITKAQSPDLQSYGFDFMEIPPAGGTNVPAGTVQFELPRCRLTTTIAVRAILKRFGWYTNAAGAPFLTFGLYVGDQLVAPGGKLLSDTPRTIETYNPSESSIAFSKLAETTIPIPPNTTVRILVTNTDPLNAYPAWGRIWGWHWEEERREDGRRAYYNDLLGEVS